MASKEVKAALKAAREALDKKEYQDALKHCKVVLRADKTNYMALVFAGVATSELQQPEQAYAAFNKATAANPDLPLAWQGLADFCVKQKDPAYYKDLTLCYERLAKMNESRDPSKFCSFSEKHGDAWLLREQPLQALACWQTPLSRMQDYPGDVVEKRRASLCRKVADVILTRLPVEYEFIEPLSCAKLADAESLKNFVLYLLRVLQISDDDVINEHRAELETCIVTECRSMRESFSDDVYCRELLCLLALVRTLVNGEALEEECTETCQELCALQETSPVVQMLKAHTLLTANQPQEALDAIGSALSVRSACPLAWCLSANVLLRLHMHSDVCHSARQGLCSIVTAQSKEYLLNPTCMKLALQRCMAKGLLSEDQESYEEAINLCNELADQEDVDTEAELLLAEAYMLNGDATQTYDICDTVLRRHPSTHRALYLQSCAEAACQHFRSAEESISEAVTLRPDASEYHLQYGRLLWETEDAGKRVEARACFMKAAELDPRDSRPFYELGIVFSDLEKSVSKAQRCFQKAVDLSSSNLKAVTRLGQCLQAQGYLTEALDLYQKLTISMPASQAHIAWSRLGALQLDTGHSQEAIASLQTALRTQPRDGTTWEALGTAYMDRGSYSSALKALLRSVQLSSSTYSLCKIADIKNRLGLNSEAIVDYRRLLESNEAYLPAWNGLAESYCSLARGNMSKNFDKTAVDCVSEVLAAVACAVALNPKLLCLWKMMGDACMLLTPLPSDVLDGLVVPEYFAQQQQQQQQQQSSARAKLLSLASRAYVQGLHVTPDPQYNHWLWHDLGVNYYEQMKEEAGDQQRTKLGQQALQAIQNAVRLQQDDSSHWNALGVFCAHADINRLALAQHAFIKALQLQPDDAVTWSNLGALYVSQSNLEMAHQAFAKAQAVDPEYVGGWVGQAMVAEFMEHAETQDLYHHASELAYHGQAALGLSQWVCSNLLEVSSSSSDGAAEAIPASTQDAVSDLMEKVSRRHPENSAALSMLGVVLERRKLFKLAEQAYARVCVNLMDSPVADKNDVAIALSNHARVLCLCGRYTESMVLFSKMDELRQEDYCWWALGCYHDKEHLQSGMCIQLFEKALQLTTTARDRSAIFTAAAMAAYRCADADKCKTFLMSSSQVQPAADVCQEGLCALTSLAILQMDITLATAALVELRKPDITDVSLRASRTYIESVYRMVLGETESGCREWLKEIHRSPADGELWGGLGKFMIQTQTSMAKCHQITATAALLQPSLASSTQLFSSLSLLAIGQDSRAALRAVQKAVLSRPTSPYAWAALAACLSARRGSSPPSQSPGAEGTGGAEAEQGDVQVADGEIPDTAALIAMCHGSVRDGLQSAVTQPDCNVQHTKAKSLQQLFGWMIVHSHFVRSRAGLGAAMEDAAHVSALPGAVQIGLGLQLVTLLAEAGQLQAAGTPLNAAQLSAVRQVVMANQECTAAWKCLARCYDAAGAPAAAELSLRQAVTVASKAGGNPGLVMLRLAILGLQQHAIGSDAARWMSLAQEAMREAQKFCQQSFATQVLHAVVTFRSGNAKFAARLFGGLLSRCEGTPVHALLQYYSMMAQLKLKNYDVAKALLADMKRTGSPFHLKAFELFQSLS